MYAGSAIGLNCHALRFRNRGEWYGPKAKSGIFLTSIAACNRASRIFSIVVRFPIWWALGIVSVTCKDRKGNYQSVLRKVSSTSCCLTNDLGLYGPKMGRLPTYLSQVFCLDHSHRMPEKWLTVTVIFLKVISWLFIVKSWEINDNFRESISILVTMLSWRARHRIHTHFLKISAIMCWPCLRQQLHLGLDKTLSINSWHSDVLEEMTNQPKLWHQVMQKC